MYDIPTYYPHTAHKKYLFRRLFSFRCLLLFFFSLLLSLFFRAFFYSTFDLFFRFSIVYGNLADGSYRNGKCSR